MKTVQIRHIDYAFCHHINDDPALLASFNTLAAQTFGISFDQVGGEYEPHVLIHDGRVVANVSVNQIPFLRQGQRMLGIQLGTVMTAPDWRGHGLSRWLMETVLRQWLGHCDTLYLFANDSVLDFYPRFGFQPAEEWEYRVQIPRKAGTLRPLQLGNPADWALLWEKYAQGNPYSALSMVENRALLNFYAGGFRRECFYYAPALDLVLALEEEGGQLWCLDVFGQTNAPLTDVLALLPPSKRDTICLGFPPLTAIGQPAPHKEEDTTLFVHHAAGDPFAGAKLLFPLLSHA